MKIQPHKSYLEASARQRLDDLLDKHSFKEFYPPEQKDISPHLAMFNIPPQFDDGVIVGEGTLNDQSVTVIAQEGRFMGGALGEVHSAKITGILKRSLRTKPQAVLFLLDSGGVRLQEANAGEIGVTEIIRAIFDIRAAAIPVIGLVGGSCGCFGGAGIISGCCDILIGSEEGRVGVSGPEVIETTMGVDAFDSRDRALVWRTTGCKNRLILGIIQVLTDNSPEAFKAAIMANITNSEPNSLATIEQRQAMLTKRFQDFSECQSAVDVWGKLGYENPEKIPDMPTDKFVEAVNQTQSTACR